MVSLSALNIVSRGVGKLYPAALSANLEMKFKGVSFRVEDLKLTGFLSLVGVSLPFQQ